MPPPWVTYLNVSFINVNFCLIQYLLIERWPLFGADKPAPTPKTGPLEKSTVPTIGMLRRRPDGLNGRILYIQADDHYLHVKTDQGKGLSLHRMSDAVDDLTNADGLQVHRSWWVARDAVAEISKEGRRRTITAIDGTAIPVGRSFEKLLRTQEWI